MRPDSAWRKKPLPDSQKKLKMDVAQPACHVMAKDLGEDASEPCHEEEKIIFSFCFAPSAVRPNSRVAVEREKNYI